MKIEQIYTGCLAQGAYYITSEGEAVVIDPLREITPYLEKAKKDDVKIKYVLETHFHADFVSGHLDLAKHTGATIVYGPHANPSFDAYIATDGEELTIGKVKIRVLHTPGHTMESTCYLLFDEEEKEKALFTGDTLFIGDVGRPDLAQKRDLTINDLAGHLYDSLHSKIIPLPDHITIFPAHGAGSACGKNMAKETVDTLKHQKETNYALRDISKEQFIKEVTEGLMTPPSYFPENVRLNKEGYESIEEVINRGSQPLNADAFEMAANEMGALILDTRDPQTFAQGFIPNSINIGIDGSFAPWVGALIPDIKQALLIVADNGREEEVITRLARVGFDHAIGYLEGGFLTWQKSGKEIDQVISHPVETIYTLLAQDSDATILDVRKPAEFKSEHVANAHNIPLDYINESMEQIDKERTYFVHCAGGYRSMIFISILKARGYDRLIDIKGGFKSIKSNGSLPLESYPIINN